MNTSQATLSSKQISNPVLRYALLAVGGLCVALGVLGIFLPILPTTPFLLLAAACYVRSSQRFYQWLLDAPTLAQDVLCYLDGSGMPLKAKKYTLLMLWLTMPLAIYLVPFWPVRIILGLIGLCVSIYILRLPEPQRP